MKRNRVITEILGVSLFFSMTTALFHVENVYAADNMGWVEENGVKYWYENGVKQGTQGRGKEIYDPDSEAWYWLDAVDGGRMAVSKDVYQESKAGEWGDTENEAGEKIGKWVRYDEAGHMVKGWDSNDNGTYYFDLTYGTMAKGEAVIDGQTYYFDENTGILQGYPKDDDGIELSIDGWHKIDGVNYWYENGVRQGYDREHIEYRGKEIYDPDSDAWYWLDNVQQGAVAKSKDVYQESEAGNWGDIKDESGKTYGKWVRYDENGHMVKGWNEKDGNTYYFDPVYGTMAKGLAKIDDRTYYFDPATGVMAKNITMKIDGDIYAFGEDGKQLIALPLKSLVYSWNGKSGYTYEYDEQDRLIKKIYYEADTIKSWTTYEYNEQGKQSRVIDFDWNGVTQYTEYEYYENGEEAKCTFKDRDGNIILWIEYLDEYGDNGKKCIWTYKNNDGIMMWREWDYDHGGRLIKNYDKYPDGSIKMIEEHEYCSDGGYTDKTYDENGELYTQYTYDKFGNEIIRKTKGMYFEWTYNENNQLIKYRLEHYTFVGKRIDERTYNVYGDIESEIGYDNDGKIIDSSEYEYEYSSDGKKMSCIGCHSDTEYGYLRVSSKSMTEYEYDEVGNCVRERKDAISYDDEEDKWILSAIQKCYEYDRDGNMIKESFYYTKESEYLESDTLREMENVNWIISSIKKYDADGNQLGCYYYTDGVISSEYEYDSTGKEIKEVYYNNEGSVTYWYKHEYNEWGDVLTYKKFIGEGEQNLSAAEEYEYDSYGNLLNYKWCGSIKKEYEYIYR